MSLAVRYSICGDKYSICGEGSAFREEKGMEGTRGVLASPTLNPTLNCRCKKRKRREKKREEKSYY